MHYFPPDDTNANNGRVDSQTSTARPHIAPLPEVEPDVPVAKPFTEIDELTGAYHRLFQATCISYIGQLLSRYLTIIKCTIT
jgi:hypothetical protein